MKERIIGVDYLEPITRNGMWKFQITIVEGLTFLGSNNVTVKDFDEIFNILCALSVSYKAKINFENNKHRLYLLFKDRGHLDLLRDNDIPRCLMSNNREVKGFTYVCALKDLFNSYSDMLEYDKEFEDSYRIAVLPILYDKTTQCRLHEIKCLERKLKEAKDSL
jgi:hypothetical protein